MIRLIFVGPTASLGPIPLDNISPCFLPSGVASVLRKETYPVFENRELSNHPPRELGIPENICDKSSDTSEASWLISPLSLPHLSTLYVKKALVLSQSEKLLFRHFISSSSVISLSSKTTFLIANKESTKVPNPTGEKLDVLYFAPPCVISFAFSMHPVIVAEYNGQGLYSYHIFSYWLKYFAT